MNQCNNSNEDMNNRSNVRPEYVIENPSSQVQLVAVQQDIGTIHVIEKPSEAIQNVV